VIVIFYPSDVLSRLFTHKYQSWQSFPSDVLSPYLVT